MEKFPKKIKTKASWFEDWEEERPTDAWLCLRALPDGESGEALYKLSYVSYNPYEGRIDREFPGGPWDDGGWTGDNLGELVENLRNWLTEEGLR